MYVCICAAVTQSAWQEALTRTGSIETASMETGAGQGCGGCRHFLAGKEATTPSQPSACPPCPPLLANLRQVA